MPNTTTESIIDQAKAKFHLFEDLGSTKLLAYIIMTICNEMLSLQILPKADGTNPEISKS